MNPDAGGPADSASPAVAAEVPKRSLPRRAARMLGRLLGWACVCFLLLATTGWSALTIYFADTTAGHPRTVAAGAFVVASLAMLAFIRRKKYAVLACLGMFALVVGWYFTLQPSNARDWAPDVAQIPSADVAGDVLTVHNVRDFDYRSETDFTPRWETRTYDLSKLRSVDFMAVHWGSRAIAHAMVSFCFDDGKHLAVSIEARRERAESYSAIQGFFRQYELINIFADERDVVRLRTNFRHEDVYLFRSNLTPAQSRDLLMSYVEHANELARQPQFYNALTSNCATNVLTYVRSASLPTQMSWRILLSGYAPDQMYANGKLDRSLPFEELRDKSHVNDAAVKVADDQDFSALIRVGLPVPPATKP